MSAGEDDGGQASGKVTAPRSASGPASSAVALRMMWVMWCPSTSGGDGSVGGAGKPGGEVLEGAAIELPVAFLGDVAQVVRKHSVRRGEERVPGLQGFLVEDVQGGAADPPLVQCPDERVLVYQGSAGGVDQEAFGAQQLQLGLTHDVLRPRGEPQVERCDVGHREEFLL